MEAAHLTRRPPWQTIGDLGEATGVTALQELSAALSLAGSEGARIKATLSARSAALSAHQLAEAEASRRVRDRGDGPARRRPARRVPDLHRVPGVRRRDDRLAHLTDFTPDRLHTCTEHLS